MATLRAAMLALLTAVSIATTAAPAEAKRIALVVGNDAYQHLNPLKKAVNDARAVKAALEDLGFRVIDGENLTRGELSRRLTQLDKAIEKGDQVFIFFSGHGLSVGAENYLLSIDMPLPDAGEERLVMEEGLAADRLVRSIQERGAMTTFMVLDACRDNPIKGAGRSIGDRGLARMDPPAGVFVLFAAGIGQKALDRLNDTETEANSVFTRKLVPLLRTPGLTHIALAKELQQEVSKLAASVHHKQEPAYYDQIIGHVVLKDGSGSSQIGAGANDPTSTRNEDAIRQAEARRREAEEAARAAEERRRKMEQEEQDHRRRLEQNQRDLEDALKERERHDLEAKLRAAEEKARQLQRQQELEEQTRAAEEKARELERQRELDRAQERDRPPPEPPSRSASSGGSSCDDLWYRRNAIFAKYGYCFKSDKAIAVFGKVCRSPFGKLPSGPQREVDAIQAQERSLGCN